MGTAFIIGLLVALNPCQLAITASALTFLSKDRARERTIWLNGIFYSLGRFCAYLLLGWACLFVDIVFDERLTVIVERLLPYFLILFSIFFLIRAFRRRHHHHDLCHNSGFIIHRFGRGGSFLLGFLLAFAFCPESAILFFGVVVPLSFSVPEGWGVAPIFSLSVILPSLLLTWLMAHASQAAAFFQLRMERFQFWSNLLLGIVFIVVALLLLFLPE